jgi:hypothetical protein
LLLPSNFFFGFSNLIDLYGPFIFELSRLFFVFLFYIVRVPFLEEVKDVESPNSCALVEVGLDEIPSTLGVNSLMFHSHVAKVNPFHVIFDLNGV